MIGQIAQFHLSVCGTLTSVCSSSQNERFLKLSMFETLKKLESHLAVALCDSYASLGLATSHAYL